ncbi:atos homolog protein A isoform X1 [Parasteatoda tepidariorum]|nr:protein FAM214A isoform X1 [Parasteatoda tepidariorum]
MRFLRYSDINPIKCNIGNYEMHAAVEEVDLDPCDLYTVLGTLIVEGRLPGISEKGFGEGPHCANPQGQNRHQCDQSSSECQKYEQILKHMLLLWKNSIPMTIEVLLYPSCCTPFQNVDSVPDLPYILIEQWTIHMLPRRVPDASITSRGLIQAVRSFLYFSQLCAWYSSSGGKSPQNVHYRVCVPGEAFSSRFSSQPDCHIFPVANVGRSSAMKVLVKSLPRCGAIPNVPCHKHSDPQLPLKSRVEAPESIKSSVGEYPCDGILSTGVSSRTNSPADTMLGESLLDPPNSLCMYPKRYQSPSRCGSPSIEVPEHLMFGKAGHKREEQVSKRKSRPQRRPVVERFLKKDMGDCSISDSKSMNFDKSYTLKDPSLNFLSQKRDPVLNYCVDDSLKHVPKEEMEHVLERLRDRHVHKKSLHADHDKSLIDNGTNLKEKSLSKYFEKMNINPALLDGSYNSKKAPFLKLSECSDLKPSYKQPLWLIKESNKKPCDSESKSISSSDKPSPSSDIQNHWSLQPHNSSLMHLKESNPTNLLPNKVNFFQSPSYLSHKRNDSNAFQTLKQKSSRTPQNTSQSEYAINKPYQRNNYWNSVRNSEIHPKYSSVNIKKCGALLPKNSDELCDERELSGLNDDPSVTSDANIEDKVNQSSFEVPSAEKKALFRRSLDSATTLVFHQRSGLPLTSSPAPMRKCGTCFDFDSSIISVSAIKRALFEKDPEEEIDLEKDLHFSTSAPASIFSSSLLGTFEESVLNGRLEPVSTVEGFTAEIGASGSFCPRHIKLPVTVFFYTLHDMDKVTSPYMGHINLNCKDYHVPKRGTVQVTLFNPHDTVVKMFVVRYDLSDMPINCQTFLRQRTLYMPSDASESDTDAQKWLRYLIHLRFMSSKSGRIYLHTDIRMIIFRKSDLDAATVHGQRPYELRTFTHGPSNPKFSPHKP